MESVLDKSSINQKMFENIEESIQEKKKIDLLNKVKIKQTNEIPKKYGASLYKLLSLKSSDSEYVNNNEPVQLKVTIPFDRIKREIQSGSMSANIDKEGKDTVYDKNGKKLTEEDITKINQNIINESKNYVAKKRENIIKALIEFRDKNKSLIANKFIDTAIKDGKNTFKFVLKKADINKFVEENKENIVYIDLPQKLAPKVAGAMVSSRVDPYALNYGNTGTGIGVYIGELNCPNTSHINNYTRLSGNCTLSNTTIGCVHSRNVTSIARAVSPDAHIYCKAVTNDNNFVPSNSQRSNILIESYSIGRRSSDDIDTIYRDMDRDLDNEAYDHNIPVFTSAGNHDEPVGNQNWNADDTWNVSSPAKGFNTITVGNYDDQNNEINLLEGHGSAHRDPETGMTKPEISLPGTSIAAGGATMTGTSQAAPHAAAFAADLMDKFSWLQYKPYILKALLLSSATKNISGDNTITYNGIGNRTGLGGLNFYSASYNLWYYWWWGSYDYIASHDNGTNDNYIEQTVHINHGGKVRVVISWLNDGDYTLSHRTADHPIGKDFDLRVYDPNGNRIETSSSWDNSFEVINFFPSQVGNYKVVINMYKNRDTNAPTYLSLSINW